MSGIESGLSEVKSNETSPDVIGEDSITKAIRACQAIEIAILLFTIWILLCAIIYGYKTKKWRKRSGSETLHQGIMYSCCIAAIALTLPRILFGSVLYFVHPDILSPICESMMDISNGLYLLAMYPTYFYLWLRHRAIYCHSAVRKIMGKCILVFGWAVLFMATGVSVAQVWVYTAPKRYVGSPTGCVFDSRIEGHENIRYGLAGSLVVVQISLLVLFIYPMTRRELNQIKKRSESVSTSQATGPNEETNFTAKAIQRCFACREILCAGGDRNLEQDSSLRRTIRRSFYGALVTMISDITVMVIVSFAMSHSTPQTMTRTVYDVSLCINCLCILSTFGNNKKILCVCWSCPNDIASERKMQDSMPTDETRMNNVTSRSENV